MGFLDPKDRKIKEQVDEIEKLLAGIRKAIPILAPRRWTDDTAMEVYVLLRKLGGDDG